MSEDKSQISDGYHTFAELYDHRNALFLCLIKERGGWAARKHHDGTSYDGWFIAGTEVDGQTITYHLPDNLWNTAYDCGASLLDKAPEWDGHTSEDVVERLLNHAKA